MKHSLPLVVLASLAIASCDGGDAAACDGGCPDARLDAPVFRDAPRRDAPARDATRDVVEPPSPRCTLAVGRRSGAACDDGICVGSLECEPERPRPGPGAVCPDLDLHFPGSMCVQRCDPDAGGLGCDDVCAVCSAEILVGRTRLALPEGICRPRCRPSTTDDGCERDGYACDVLTGTCMEACTTDEQCSATLDDLDGDGFPELSCIAGTATCNHTTGRCEWIGGAPPGAPCLRDTDCADGGVCLDFETGSRCARFGCDVPGFECEGPDESCDVRAFGDGMAACLEACTVGAEITAEQRRGSTTGGSPDCSDPGMACHWNGLAASTDVPNGSCLPGNYNDEPAYDVGTACLDDAECWSPFGYGRCLFTNALDQVQSGMCAVGGCLGGSGGMPIGLLAGTDAIHAVDPDVFAEICAAGDLCLNFGTTEIPRTFCVHGCDEAEDCPAGYACPNLNTPDMPIFICWPFCQMDEDCHGGATCEDAAGGTCGAGETGCSCSDAMPAPDGATPGGDAGTDAGTPEVDGGHGRRLGRQRRHRRRLIVRDGRGARRASRSPTPHAGSPASSVPAGSCGASASCAIAR